MPTSFSSKVMRILISWGKVTFEIYYIWERTKIPVPQASNQRKFTTSETALLNKLLTVAELPNGATKDFLIKQTIFILLDTAKGAVKNDVSMTWGGVQS